MGEVPTGVWVAAVIIVYLICHVTFWVTRKAYSKKWEEDE